MARKTLAAGTGSIEADFARSIGLNFDAFDLVSIPKLFARRCGTPVDLPAIHANFQEIYAKIQDDVAKERLIERFVVSGASTKKLLTGKRVISGSSKVNTGGFWLECGDHVPSTSMTFARLSACLHFENGRMPPEKRKVPSMVVRIPWNAFRAVDDRIATFFKYFMGPGFAFVWRLMKEMPGYTASDNARFVMCCYLLDWQAHVNTYNTPSLTFRDFARDSFVSERSTLQSLVRNNPTAEAPTYSYDPLKMDKAGKRLLAVLWNLDALLLPRKGNKQRCKKSCEGAVMAACSAEVLERVHSALAAL